MHALAPHPDTPATAITRVGAEITRLHEAVRLRFEVAGDIAALALPPAAAPGRADELWRRTCFEAFIRAGDGLAYREINLSPSTQWAAYAFDAYRAGMRAVDDVGPAAIVCGAGETFELSATLPVRFARDQVWRVGLSAVIEETGGVKSYWALAHASGAPDFHHASAFTLTLEPP